MKISMHNWMRPEPIETTLERLHRLGYDGIEISGEPDRHDTAAIRRLLDEYGLECWGGVTMMFPGRDLVHEDRTVRVATVAYMKDCLKFIQGHGAGLTPAADYDRATRDNITHLKECLASAVGAAG